MDSLIHSIKEKFVQVKNIGRYIVMLGFFSVILTL